MSLETFIADVTSRYPVTEIVVFGSRGRGGLPSPDSDWDVVVCLDDGVPVQMYRSLLEDRSLQRHFPTFLDLFTLDDRGEWGWPSWTCDESGGRGFFPTDSAYRDDIRSSSVTVWQVTP